MRQTSDVYDRLTPGEIAELQDNCEPLLTIADVAGGDWPKLARAALLKISKCDNGGDSIGCELLSDIKEIFGAKLLTGGVSLKDLLSYLCEDEEMPWATYNRGKPMTTRQLSKKLRSYGIETKQDWYGVVSGTRQPAQS